LIARNRRVTG